MPVSRSTLERFARLCRIEADEAYRAAEHAHAVHRRLRGRTAGGAAIALRLAEQSVHLDELADAATQRARR